MRQVPPKSSATSNNYHKDTPESPDGKFGAFSDDDDDDVALYHGSGNSS